MSDPFSGISHGPEETLNTSYRLTVMHRGQVLLVGKPAEIEAEWTDDALQPAGRGPT